VCGILVIFGKWFGTKIYNKKNLHGTEFGLLKRIGNFRVLVFRETRVCFGIWREMGSKRQIKISCSASLNTSKGEQVIEAS
jgi:hypothetical protein